MQMKISLNDLLEKEPFSLDKNEKKKIFNILLRDLTIKHYNSCEEYRKILTNLGFNPKMNYDYEEIPPLPVRLFKMFDLLSVDKSSVVKTLKSSGTSGGNLSKIFLDKGNSINQIKVLTKITSDFLRTKNRLPMLIIDCESVLKDRKSFSARGAGILGFSILGKNITYALDNDYNINLEKVNAFIDKYKGQKKIIFGFTHMIWKYFLENLNKKKISLDLSSSILIHGGGWKKLIDLNIYNDQFKESIKKLTNINKVFNYYGMVEQTGSIFIECEEGNLHSSIFSDIIIRDSGFSKLEFTNKGIIELVSLLPNSYPGHAILTEDIGEILGEDDCPCKRLGKYFKVHGRLSKAEIRGCSDSYENR